MKNLTVLKLFLVLVMALQSCEKEDSKKEDYIEDYRTKYTGNFNFTVRICTYSDTTVVSDTTIIYLGEIHETINCSDQITIDYVANYAGATLEQDGTLHKPLQASLGWSFGGKFVTKDSISFSSGWGVGIISNPTIHAVRGKRIP